MDQWRDLSVRTYHATKGANNASFGDSSDDDLVLSKNGHEPLWIRSLRQRQRFGTDGCAGIIFLRIRGLLGCRGAGEGLVVASQALVQPHPGRGQTLEEMLIVGLGAAVAGLGRLLGERGQSGLGGLAVAAILRDEG